MLGGPTASFLASLQRGSPIASIPMAWRKPVLTGSRCDEVEMATDRVGAFVTAFGIWDLSYYAVLRLVSGWSDSISIWDIFFLIYSP